MTAPRFPSVDESGRLRPKHLPADAAAARSQLGAAAAVHTHASTSITDFAEAARDAVAAMMRAGTNVTFAIDDAGDTFTINAAGGGGGAGDPEVIRDVIGGAIVGGANIQVTVNDAADQITIAVTGLTKSSVGLPNVDNTSDADKPVSTAQLTAINAKYTKPAGGIPELDLAPEVQGKLVAASGGTTVKIDGQPAQTVEFSPVLPTPAELGAAPASLADVVAGKADLDPVTGKVLATQLPAGSGGGGTGNLLIITGESPPVVDGSLTRIDFSAGSRVIGTGFTFASPPQVFTEIISTASAATTRYSSATSIDATGFTLAFQRSNTTPTSARWLAIGVSP